MMKDFSRVDTRTVMDSPGKASPFHRSCQLPLFAWRVSPLASISDLSEEDEIYLKVKGKWCYLYRAMDADGNLVDSQLSEKRDREAAQRFFRQALAVVGHALSNGQFFHLSAFPFPLDFKFT